MTSQEQYARTLLQQGELLQLEQYLGTIKKWNKNLIVLRCLIKIFHMEVKSNLSFTVFDYSTDLTELVNHFVTVKLLLRRLEFDLPRENQLEACIYFVENNVSCEYIFSILLTNIFYQEKVCERLIELFREVEENSSRRVGYFLQVLKYIKEKTHGR